MAIYTLGLTKLLTKLFSQIESHFKKKLKDYTIYSICIVFKTQYGADNGSRTHLSGLGSPHTTDVLYPHGRFLIKTFLLY